MTKTTQPIGRPTGSGLTSNFSMEELSAYERNATCEVCDRAIFRNSGGGFTHEGNTTSSPETCYFPNGSMTTGRPAGYQFDYVTRTWHHPAMISRRASG